ncbi:MAG: hypothetical protein LC754_13075, partial [Acidobacteria bacterium]|nr:hypothetical protein [Acidobacteriota bacterium]
DTRDAGGQEQADWKLSEEELREFERAGLFTKEELESVVVNRYRAGVVKFHDAASRVKAEPLWVNGVLDVAVDAGALLRLAADRIRAQGQRGCAVLEGLRFVRAYVERHRVTVEAVDGRGARRLFSARLFVDAAGAHSPVSRQFNDGRSFTHVCPTVGTLARGFVRGQEPDTVDFKAGEMLVTTEDAREGRQLIWQGFAASAERDEFATHLFFYDAADSPADKSLLSLFERYFEALPSYKRAGAQWRVQKPLFGHVPAFQQSGRKIRRKTSDERVLVIGEAAGLSGPQAFFGFGPHARGLRRLTHLTNRALEENLTDAASLSEMSEGVEARIAQAAGLAEFLRPALQSEPSSVNETLNAVMAALHNLDERVRRELFQDRLTFDTLRSLLSHTARLYPRIFTRMREHFGASGTFWRIVNIADAVFSERRARAAARSITVEND